MLVLVCRSNCEDVLCFCDDYDWQGLTEKKKQMQDESLWKDWLNKYVDRLKKEMDGGMTESSQKAAAETRVKLMNTNNPR